MPDLDDRRALVERVVKLVRGRGVSRSAVEQTVDRILAVLPAETADTSTVATSSATSLLAAVSARSVPDLASRVRRDLEAEGAAILDLGSGTAAQYTVVTVRVSASARDALQRLAERSGFSLTFPDPQPSDFRA